MSNIPTAGWGDTLSGQNFFGTFKPVTIVPPQPVSVSLSGDVIASGVGSATARITSHAVTNTKLALMAPETIKANINPGLPGDAQDVTFAALKDAMGIAASNVSGLGALATQSSVNLASQTTGKLPTSALNTNISNGLALLDINGRLTQDQMPNSAGSTSNKILLAVLTAANVATLFDTSSLSGTYAYYEIVIENLLPATNAVTLLLQPHVSGAFQAAVASVGTRQNTSATLGFTSTTGQLNPTAGGVSNAAVGGGISGTLTVRNPSGTTAHKRFVGLMDFWESSGVMAVASVSAAHTASPAAVTGFQLKFSAGNILSGKVKIYGYN